MPNIHWDFKKKILNVWNIVIFQRTSVCEEDLEITNLPPNQQSYEGKKERKNERKVSKKLSFLYLIELNLFFFKSSPKDTFTDFREREREGEWEGEKHQSAAFCTRPTRTEPTT